MNPVTNFEGIIEVTRIENSGDNSAAIGTLTARFVRYPGCQQLSVWLPESAYHGYGKIKIVEERQNTIIDDDTVADKRQGSKLLVWETISWMPGRYRMEIEHPKGGIHSLYFSKLEEDDRIPKDSIIEMPIATADSPSLLTDNLEQNEMSKDESNDSLWKEYKDGFGKSIPNMDHEIRERTNDVVQENVIPTIIKMQPRLEYENLGRGGYVIYREVDACFRLWHEVGGGDCKWNIEIPNEGNWEKETNTPLERRREILLFIASEVRRDQAVSWRFEIGDTVISFY